MMRRLIALVTVSGVTVLGLAVVGGPSEASSVPTNGKIAFGRFNVALDDYQTFTINPDGTGEHRLLPGASEGATWSPDGTKIAVTIHRGQFIRSATLNPDGSGLKVVTPPGPSLSCRAWSPDGQRLACAGWGPHPKVTDGLYTIRASDGGDLRQLTTYPNGTRDGQFTNDIPLGYSSDGSRILFDRNHNSDHGNLFVVNVDGTHLRRLNPKGVKVVSDQGDGWSPDGTQVTFAGLFKLSTGKFGSALYVVNADGTGLRQITPRGLGAFRARWSPDGQLIAFNSKFRSDPQIWVVRPDGTGLRKVTSATHGDRSFAPVWSPDSAKLAFPSFYPQEDLWIVNADGSGLFQLTNTPDTNNSCCLDESEPAWGTAPVG